VLAITYGNLYFKWPKIVFSYCQTHKREIAQIVDINGNTFLTNSIPITVKDKIKGAVAIFTDIESIQKNEINVRKHLNKKGFVAKYKFSDILGNSDAILQTKELAESYAKTDFTVLITGESGVGKELFAQSIHNSSLRKTGPFVAINCSALNSNLLESELFGYERGSFTGARSEGKPGLFELAHNGTIFLDEIAEIPIEIQVKLLRVLQEKEIIRIGGEEIIPVDVRVIAATNKNLLKLVNEGHFREDLYYRLNVLSLEIPPLRERKEDIPVLIRYFCNELCQKYKISFEISSRELDYLFDYSWPGNIRELRNFIHRLFALYLNSTDLDKRYNKQPDNG